MDIKFTTVSELKASNRAQFVVNSGMCNIYEIQDRRTGRVVAASSKMRGGVADSEEPTLFNVCSATFSNDKNLEPTAVKKSVLTVLLEKIIHDLHAANTVLDKAFHEGVISDDVDISWEDVLEEVKGRCKESNLP